MAVAGRRRIVLRLRTRKYGEYCNTLRDLDMPVVHIILKKKSYRIPDMLRGRCQVAQSPKFPSLLLSFVAAVLYPIQNAHCMGAVEHDLEYAE